MLNTYASAHDVHSTSRKKYFLKSHISVVKAMNDRSFIYLIAIDFAEESVRYSVVLIA